MNFNKYKVILTNGTVNHEYIQNTFTEEQAIILSQAEAIKNARGYEFVSIEKM